MPRNDVFLVGTDCLVGLAIGGIVRSFTLDGAPIATFGTPFSHGGERAAVTPDGRALIVASWSGRIAKYALPEGQALWEIRGTRRTQCLAASPTGVWVCGEEGPGILRSYEDGSELARERGARKIFCDPQSDRRLTVTRRTISEDQPLRVVFTDTAVWIADHKQIVQRCGDGSECRYEATSSWLVREERLWRLVRRGRQRRFVDAEEFAEGAPWEPDRTGWGCLAFDDGTRWLEADGTVYDIPTMTPLYHCPVPWLTSQNPA